MLWVMVLNRALEWGSATGTIPGELLRGESGSLPAAAQRQLAADLVLLRATHAAAALPRPLSRAEDAALRQWLAAVTLRLAASEKFGTFALPGLRARRSGSLLPAALEELLSTSLLELLGLGAAVGSVGRCHGVVRAGAPSVAAAEDETRFAQVAGLEALVASGWRQCPQLVCAPRGARYCSKACSNAAFALRKGGAEPRYFARKQARYRARQALPARPAPSAFVAFID